MPKRYSTKELVQFPIGTTNSIVEQLGGDMKELEKFIL